MFALVLTSYFHRVHRTTPDTLSEAFNGLFTLKGKKSKSFCQVVPGYFSITPSFSLKLLFRLVKTVMNGQSVWLSGQKLT